jgi:hypothetical protein
LQRGALRRHGDGVRAVLGITPFSGGTDLELWAGMRSTGLALLGLLLATVGCAQTAPQELSSAYPEVAPAPIEASASAADLDGAAAEVPAAGRCDTPPQTDPRCPEEVLTAAALSYLDKTVAEFDGRTMKIIAYDRDALLAEAFADAGFRRLLQHADVAPADGILDHAEARSLEASVLALLETRFARRELR